jgi:AcrR family transcriptional regulator
MYGPNTVTVESVVQAAGIAKGTFYLHFHDLSALEAELGDVLIRELTDRLEPALEVVADPLTRMATGVEIFLRDLAGTPPQARLAAHAIASLPRVGKAVQAHLREDLAEAEAMGLLGVASVDLATGIVVNMAELAARLFGNGSVDASSVPEIVRAALRAVGCTPGEANARAEAAARHADALVPSLAPVLDMAQIDRQVGHPVSAHESGAAPDL